MYKDASGALGYAKIPIDLYNTGKCEKLRKLLSKSFKVHSCVINGMLYKLFINKLSKIQSK